MKRAKYTLVFSICQSGILSRDRSESSLSYMGDLTESLVCWGQELVSSSSSIGFLLACSILLDHFSMSSLPSMVSPLATTEVVPWLIRESWIWLGSIQQCARNKCRHVPCKSSANL